MAKILVTSAAIRKFDLVDSGGDLNVVENALITVTDKNSGAILNLFDQNDPDSLITNPFNANADGQFAFYVEAGEIKIFAQTIVDSTLLTGSAFVSVGQSGGGTILRLSDYASEGATAAAVGDALEKISAEIQDGYTIDLSGNWKWGEKSLRVEGKKGVTIRGGLFTKTSGEAGAEFPIWVRDCDGVKVNSLTLDGGEIGVVFGQQGLYLPRSVNTTVSNCTFLNIGDAPIRYAEKTTEDAGTTTDGLVVTGCVFHNCTQVTSNNTGAYNVVIDGNVFKNSAIKVTQTTDQITGATIISNNNFHGINKPITAQGFYKLHVTGNVMRDCTQIVEFYTNPSTTQTEYVAFKDVLIEDNTLYSNSGDRAIYVEARPSVDGVTPLECDGFISVKRNIFYRQDGVTATQSTIGFFAYNAGVYLAKHYDISENKFYGSHPFIFNLGSDNPVTILNEGSLKINDNWAENEVSTRCIRISYSATESYPDFNLKICGNEFKTKQFISIDYVIGSGTKTILSNYEICNNKIDIVNFDSSENFAQIATFQNNSPLSLNTVINDNVFRFIDNSNEGGAVINMNTPLSSETRRYTHTMAGNSFITNNIGNTFPVYCSGNGAGRSFNSVCMYGNLVHDGGRANPRSDNSNFEFRVGTFVFGQESAVYITYYNKTVNSVGFIYHVTYSDGKNETFGEQELSSGNIYFTKHAPSTDYSCVVSCKVPDDSERYYPTTCHVWAKQTNLFKPSMSRLDPATGNWSYPNLPVNFHCSWYE